VIIPLVLIVIMMVLGLVLRALVAPVLLIASVVLSFAATIGACAIVFNYIFRFDNSDPSFRFTRSSSWWRSASTTTSS
jgi:putative drug exporter of the RND superfamily